MNPALGLITSNPDFISPDDEKVVIFAPAVISLTHAWPLEVATLPLCNLNAITLAALKKLEPGRRQSAYCGIFTLDPFTNWSELVRAVENAGFAGLCNYPTLPDFGESEKDSLAASGYSYEQELGTLRGLATEHLELAVYGPSDDHQAQAKLIFCQHPGVWRFIHTVQTA